MHGTVSRRRLTAFLPGHLSLGRRQRMYGSSPPPTLSGIIGTGASIMLLPLLVFQFGPKQAVPIMAIAALMSNVGKLLAWWREVDWRAFAAYSITGIPAAALGARTLLVLPAHVVDLALGLFFLMMIPGRRWLNAMKFRIRLWQLAL